MDCLPKVLEGTA